MLTGPTHTGLRRCPPKSNLQRQREFIARNPHYYRDRHRRKKAEAEARAKLMAEHPELTFAQAYDIAIGKAPAPRKAPGSAPGTAPGTAPTKAQPAEQPETPPVVLALPAPEDVVSQMVTMTLPDAFTYEPAKIRIVTPAPGTQPGATDKRSLSVQSDLATPH